MSLRLGSWIIQGRLPRNYSYRALFALVDEVTLSDEELTELELKEEKRLDEEYGWACSKGDYRRALRRHLGSILGRLSLLDHSMQRVAKDHSHGSADPDHLFGDEKDEAITFEELCALIERHPIEELKERPCDLFVELREQRPGIEFKWVLRQNDVPAGVPQLMALLSHIPPLSRLQLLGVNLANRNLPVTWHYGPALASVEMTDEDAIPRVPSDLKFLIVTEGKTDAEIIQAAVAKLRPEVADFFRFFSAGDDWPFGGAGDVPKLLKGLSILGVRLRVIGVLDNDIEGRRMLASVDQRSIGPWCRAMVLPDHPSLTSVQTLGPGNEAIIADINGTGASIETYLDLTRNGVRDQCAFRWLRWDSAARAYSGQIDPKERPRADFLRWCRDGGGAYDTSKIEAVLDALIAEAEAMAPRIGHKQFEWAIGAYDT